MFLHTGYVHRIINMLCVNIVTFYINLSNKLCSCYISFTNILLTDVCLKGVMSGSAKHNNDYVRGLQNLSQFSQGAKRNINIRVPPGDNLFSFI